MKHKLFTFLLAVLASTTTLFAWDYERVKIGDLYYNLDATNKTAEVTDNSSASGSILIPTSVTYNSVKYSVTSIGGTAFEYYSSLTSVTIPNSVTSIGYKAFRYCTGLTSVTIPNSVTSIGYEAFSYCSGLTSVTIPNSVTSIGDKAFYWCSSLTSVTINSNAIVGKGYSASSTIGSIFGSRVTEYIIGDEVTSIGGYAFDECRGLTSVTIGNSVTSIGESAFQNCSGLTSVTIGNSVTSIGSSAFYNCSSLTSVTIPNSVTSIGNSAFWGCSGLTSVTIGDGVTSIGVAAFSRCTGLTSVTIGNSVTSIGDRAFSGCSGITSVIWNAKNCSNSGGFGSQVESFVFGSEVETIPASCCEDMNKLTSLTIPNTVTSIGEEAFEGCTGLTSVHISDIAAWCAISFDANPLYYAHNLYLNGELVTDLVIPNSVTSIGAVAFSNCSGLTSVTIGNSVTSIGSSAFYNCSSLTSVTIGNSVTSIGDYAFEGCTGLTSVHISDIAAWCAISFGYDANPLYYAHNLYLNGELVTDLVIPNGVTRIGSDAFEYCTGLTSVTIPNSVTSIGSAAFANCSGLTSVTIPNSVTSIGEWVFYKCTGLTSVTIPNSVTSIGQYAFSDCSGLTSIEIPNSVTSIGNRAFEGCTGLTSVSIGNSVTSIGEYAFDECIGYVNFESANPPQMGKYCLGKLSCYVPCGASQAYHDSLPSTSFTEGHGLYKFDNTQTEDFNKLMIDNPDVWTYSDKYGAYGKKQGGATGYLMTPPTNIADNEFLADEKLQLYFRHTHRYAKEPFENEMSLWVTADYKGSFESSEWNQLTINKYASNNDWNFVSCSVNVPKSYVGPNTVFAFKYTSTASNYATWEIADISLKTICDDGTPDTYNITFKDWDGTILQSTQVEEGSLPQYNGDTPTRPEDDLYTYSFSGWSPTIVAASADVTYTATYTENQKGATPVETDKVAVTPYENTADIVWPSVSGAATYELVIRDESGNVICKLVFNAQGYLTSIAFHAPSKDRTPQKQQFTGFEFTITGLDEGTTYTFELTAKDSDGTIINSESGVFTTLGEQQAIDNTPFPSGEGRGEASKLLHNGQILILRGDKTYTLTGVELK